MDKIIKCEDKVYEVGKYYLFSDNKKNGWHPDSFEGMSQNRDYKFKAKQGKYRHIKEMPQSEVGKIEDWRLVDGEAYIFDGCGKVNTRGIYCGSTDRLYFALGRNMDPDFCTNIRKMTGK